MKKNSRFLSQGQSFCPYFFASGVGLLNENFSGQGVSPGGMVTGQTDTVLN